MIETCNVLVTAASRRVVLIRAFQDALNRTGLSGKVIATDIHHSSSALYFSNGYFIVPRVDDESYIVTVCCLPVELPAAYVTRTCTGLYPLFQVAPDFTANLI